MRDLRNKDLFFDLMVIVIITALTLFCAGAVAAVPTNAVIDDFFDQLQIEVIQDLNYRADKAAVIYECALDKSCQDADTIIDKFHEYRVYFALNQYRDINMRLKQSSQADGVYNGLRLTYSTRTDEARREWKFIKSLHKMDQSQVQTSLESIDGTDDPRIRHQMKKQLQQGQSALYSAAVSEFISAYPYFGNTKATSLNREELAEVVKKSGQAFEKAERHIQSIEGDERVELLGFTSAVERVADKLSQADAEIVANFLYSKNKDTRFWANLQGIFSYQLLALVTCHTVTYAAASVPHPIVQIARLSLGFACSSYGTTMALKYLGESTIDFVRQLQYGATKLYSHDILVGYVKSYVTTSIMAFLYVAPALPGLVGRARDIRSMSQVTARAMRMNRLSLRPDRLLHFNKQKFKEDLKGLGVSYGKYYGEELALNAIVAGGGHYLSTLNQAEAVLVKGFNKAMKRPLKIFTFADLLRHF